MATIYRARDDQGEFEFAVEEGGRVTFGPDVPYQRKEPRPFGTTYALRVYAGKGNDSLCAVFPRVEWFRPKEMVVTRIVDGEDGMILDIPPPPRRAEEGLGALTAFYTTGQGQTVAVNPTPDWGILATPPTQTRQR